MTREFLVAVCLGVPAIVGSFVPEVIGADDPPDPRLEKVLAGWQKRQSWFQAIEYQVGGKHIVPQGSYSDSLSSLGKAMGLPRSKGLIPPQNVEGPVNFTILLDFVKGRHRRSIHEQRFDLDGGKLFESEMQDVFDGSEMKCLIPKDKNPQQQVGVTQPEMTSVKGNMKNGEFRSDYYPIFFAIGRIYTAMEPILPGQLTNKPNPKGLYIHGTGVYNDRACLILRNRPLSLPSVPPPLDEYWVDTARENAIVRYVAYGGEVPAQEITIDYAMLHGHWLPQGWRWTVFMQGKTLYFEEMVVKKIKINPDITDNDFELMPIKPGMLVEERVDLPTSNPIETPKTRLSVYRIKDDGEREQIPDPAHTKGDQYVPAGRSERNFSGWKRIGWLGAFGVLTLGCAVGVFLRRRAFKRHMHSSVNGNVR